MTNPRLPKEMWMEIISKLDYDIEQIAKIREVCKTFNEICNTNFSDELEDAKSSNLYFRQVQEMLNCDFEDEYEDEDIFHNSSKYIILIMSAIGFVISAIAIRCDK